MTWTDCSRYCQGVCPCPDPPWLWKCNQRDQQLRKRDPQKRWISAMIKVWSAE